MCMYQVCKILLETLTSFSFALRQFNVSNVGCLQELAQSPRDVTQLTTDVEQLHKEKADLLEKVEAHQFTVRSSVVATELLI